VSSYVQAVMHACASLSGSHDAHSAQKVTAS